MFNYDEIEVDIIDAVTEIYNNYQSQFDMDTTELNDECETKAQEMALSIRNALTNEFIEQVQKNSKQAETKNPTVYGFNAVLIEEFETIAQINSNDFNAFRNAVVDMVETASDYDNTSVINCDVINKNGLLDHHDIIIVVGDKSHAGILVDGESVEFWAIGDVIERWGC